jgi:hypothetical protein
MGFFKKKKSKTVIWGIRVPMAVRNRWKIIAELMGIPSNRLVHFILNEWANNNQNLLLDEQLRARLASIINKAYLEGKLNQT